MNDAADGIMGILGFLVMMAILAFGIVIFGGILWGVFYEPYQQHAFTSEIQGLITEYCSAPKKADKDAARMQLKTVIEGDSYRFKQLPDALSKDANLVASDSLTIDEGGVCN